MIGKVASGPRSVVVDARMIALSGVGRFLRNVLEVLRSYSDLSLTLLGDESEIESFYPDGDVEIVQLDSSLYGMMSQFEIPRKVKYCDIFYSPHFTTTRFKVRARQRILTVHDLFHLSSESGFSLPKRIYAKLLLSGSIAASDKISVDSEFTQIELARYFPDCSDRVRVIPNCVDERIFYRGNAHPKSIEGSYVLFVGNLKPHKNLLTAATAVGELEDKSIKLAIVGAESGFIHGMGDELKDLKENSRLLFLGPVEDEELRRLYCHALCLVFPSLYEGFGLPAIEAMACGCPVVCSSIPSLIEVCGDAALYCAPRSAQEFRVAIMNLFDDPSMRDSMAAKGLERATVFSRENFAERVEDIFGLASPTKILLGMSAESGQTART